MADDRTEGVAGELPVDPDLAGIDPEAAAGPLSGHRRPRGLRPRRDDRSLLLAVALGGAAGALCRYGISWAIPSPAGAFPLATFLINVSGCLVIGALVEGFAARQRGRQLARAALVTGFVGAYTTFSTYMVDVDLLVRHHDLVPAALYALGSLVAGLFATTSAVIGTRLVLRALRTE